MDFRLEEIESKLNKLHDLVVKSTKLLGDGISILRSEVSDVKSAIDNVSAEISDLEDAIDELNPAREAGANHE